MNDDKHARWLSAKEVGALIGQSSRAVRERTSLRSDFPRPVRSIGHPRWVEAEVRAWMEAQERARAA